ncbi:PREDICTED: C-type lectin domain family 4 member G [Chinchilla lanigera]|uniref:C-type lectin domain family 4 member G n=1 Tax=Chinchilla lanigera TaxID=34839 RepID=A0A8C2UNZ3_CHILA|nr:PREDICTED: C-type lectin domain family 4 member G [Chinchilla lanigera]
MDTIRYSQWGGSSKGVPTGPWGSRVFFLALAVLLVTVLWALILSVLLSKASTERGVLFGHQDLLRENASRQTAALGALKGEVGACQSCCNATQAELRAAVAELSEARVKLMQQKSALEELSQRVTQDLATAGRDRENIRNELFRALEDVKLKNRSCEQCPTSWLPFRGSCYYFSEPRATWEEAQRNCAGNAAHLVIIGDLDEQGFLTRHTRGRGYWLGLRTVRSNGQVHGYKWVDGVRMGFSHWNTGEPNDAQGQEDCVMMLHSGLWNDAPCSSERDGWICEKRRSC